MEELPYRVVKNGDAISTHKYSGQAIDECKAQEGSHVYYVNQRGYGTVVWSPDWGTTPRQEQPPLSPKPEGGYL